jgi:drug/metabolite transporter (DMT)-like permease
MSTPQTRHIGLVVVLVSTVLWSTAGLFVRMADLDTWSIVAWRSIFAFLTLGIYWLVAKRSKAAAIGATLSWPGGTAVMIGVIGGISYIVALQLTSVANVMTVYAALPFIATAIAFFALQERVTSRFIMAGLFALGGIMIMAGAAVSVRDILGIIAAFLMTAGYAASLVQAKKYPFLDMTLITMWSAVACALIALPFVQHGLPGPRHLLPCALLGALTTGLANVMALVGGRLIRSGEAGFLLLLDVVLGPFWVWLAFDERVGSSVLAGGATVVAAVTWYLMGSVKEKTLQDSVR